MSCRTVTTTQGWMIAYNLKSISVPLEYTGCPEHGRHNDKFCSTCGEPTITYTDDNVCDMSVYDMADHLKYPHNSPDRESHEFHTIMQKGWPVQPDCDVDIRGMKQLLASNDCEVFGDNGEDSVMTHYGETSRKFHLTKEEFTERYADLIESMEKYFGQVIVVFTTTVVISY